MARPCKFYVDESVAECRDCHSIKLHSEFKKYKAGRFGIAYTCKSCHTEKSFNKRKNNPEQSKIKDKINRERIGGVFLKDYQSKWRKNNPDKSMQYHRKCRYGVSDEKYQELLMSQDGKCAICNLAPSGKKGLCVDHDHETGKVRKLLCHPCNSSLGLLNENLDTLENMKRYIIEHRV